MKADIRCGDST